MMSDVAAHNATELLANPSAAPDRSTLLDTSDLQVYAAQLERPMVGQAQPGELSLVPAVANEEDVASLYRAAMADLDFGPDPVGESLREELDDFEIEISFIADTGSKSSQPPCWHLE